MVRLPSFCEDCEIGYPKNMTIDTSPSREDLSNFLREHGAGVLATADASGKPHAATVYFTFDQVLNLYFVTKRGTQKSRNLAANPRAAIAVFDTASQTTVQAEGTVVEVSNAQDVQWVFNDIWRIAFQASPRTAPPVTRLAAGGYVVYKMAAPALRLATFARQNPEDYDSVFEVVSTQPSLH